MAVQHAKWLERVPASSNGARRCRHSTCCSPRRAGATITTASAIRGPGFIDTMLSMRGVVARVYLPPDANCLLSVADHCFRSHDYVNCIVIDKQPQLQWLDLDAARGALRARRVTLGLGEQRRPRRRSRHRPRVRRRRPDARDDRGGVAHPPVRTRPQGASRERRRPHDAASRGRCIRTAVERGLRRALHRRRRRRRSRSTATRGAMHQILHGRPSPHRFHVHGFWEQGTTTTPFDMVVLNEMSRYHLAAHAVHRTRAFAPGIPACSSIANRCSHVITPTSESTSTTCPRSATGSGARPPTRPASRGRTACGASATCGG